MRQGKKTKQILYSIFMSILAALILTGCSDTSSDQPEEKQQNEETKLEKEKDSNGKAADETELSENQKSKKTQGETAASESTKDTLTFNEFIIRWNEIDSGSLSGEIQNLTVENGIKTGYVVLGMSDSIIFTLNQKDNMINKVTLNLTYPLEEEGGGFGSDIPHQIMILMDVLEPELEAEKKEDMVKTLLSSRNTSTSVNDYNVTYSANNGDDRFYFDAVPN